MNRKPKLWKALRLSAAVVSAWLGSQAVAHAQAAPQMKFKQAEIILYMQPGTPRATVDALVRKVEAISLTPLLLTDCYKVTLPLKYKSDQATLEAVAKLKTDAKVRWVNATPIGQWHQTKAEPNDPRYLSNEQWPLKMMNLPQAWALQKGAPNTTVAVMDSGFFPDHEDLIGQYHSASRNTADNTTDILADLEPHGVHVSGTVVGKTDNGKGIAGVAWENIKCIAIKLAKKGDGGLEFDATINGWVYLASLANVHNIVACNMSFGWFSGDITDTTDPRYVSTKMCADAGIVMMASAGNSFPFPNTSGIPAAYKHIVSIGSVGPTGLHAFDSSAGKVDIASPGGDQSIKNEDGVLSTWMPNTNSYEYLQGTSMAAPNATGVVALVRSVPGVTAERAIQVIKETANKAGLTSLPDDQYGFGVIDAYKAVAAVSVLSVVVDPRGVDSNGNPSDPTGLIPLVETFQPTIRVKIGLVKPENVVVTLDGVALTTQELRQNIESGNPDAPNPQYVIAFRRKLAQDGGQHTVNVTATNPDTGITRSDTRIFTVQPRTLRGFPRQGQDGKVRNLAFISFPYKETAADSPTGAVRDVKELFGASAISYRYQYLQQGDGVQGSYSIFGAGADDVNPEAAKINTGGLPTSTIGNSPKADIRPVGLAWFVDIPENSVMNTFGQEYGAEPVRIPLTEGWNMVGNPYPHAIPFFGTLLELPTGERVPLPEAAQSGLVLPFIYRYVLDGYEIDGLPNGQMLPWQGHWIFVKPSRGKVDLTRKYALITVPGVTPATRSASTRASQPTTRPVAPVANISGANSWALRLDAQVGTLRDTANFVGMTTNATAQKALTRVPKPPMPSPYVTVGIANAEAPGLLYTQDIQAVGGTRTWDVVVNTDQKEADVTLSTSFVGSLPRNYRVTMTDKATGQSVDLRNQRNYRFKLGAQNNTRAFIITARPTTLGRRALMTNVFVNPSRVADGRSVPAYEIGYNISQDAQVEVAILSGTGRPLASVGVTRAANLGENRVVWNGRDNAGRAVPAGTYVVQLRAVTQDGEVTRVVQPLLISGR